MNTDTLSLSARHMLRMPLLEMLSSIPDFRIRRRMKHELHEILAVAALATICGASGFRDYERFGNERLVWLKTFLRLENGIPSHDTFRRVFTLMDPRRFNAALVKWIRSVADVAGDTVSIDGKCIRRAMTRSGRQPCIVSAHSSRKKLVIGQVKADEKSNEISAIPELLHILYIKGCIVTIDAAGCQKKIVRKIVSKDADYVISLKGNQSTMHEEIALFFEDALKANPKAFASASSVSVGHGRVETRTCWQSDDIGWFEDKKEWAGMKSVCCVKADVYRKKTGTTTSETRYFISSLPVDPKRALEAVRAHWGVESMHWTLDMVFDEDRSRARTGNAAENLSMLRHLVLNVLRLDKTVFGGISAKRKTLTWNERKLFELLRAVA